MRIPKIVYYAVALVTVALILGGCPAFQAPPKGTPQSLLKQADAAAREAENTKGNVRQIDAFTEALNKYSLVSRKQADSPESAVAQVSAAKLMLGLPIDAKPGDKLVPVYRNPKQGTVMLVWPVKTTWQKQNEYAARDAFRQVEQVFGNKGSFKEMSDNYTPEGAAKIRDAVEESKVFGEQAAKEIDVQNHGNLLYEMMDGLVAVTGRHKHFSYWFAIILLTVIVKILITPLTKAQFKSMKEMQRIQPLVKDLQAKYKGDQKELGPKLMALYKEHGVNPLAGCLPILIQMPILILVYTAIRYYEYQFAQGTFLWIGFGPFVHKWAFALSAGGAGKPIWLTAANLAQPDLILLVMYTISMIVSQKISIVDPTQAEQQKMMAIMMPLMFFFIIGYLPSAFVFYWLTFNVLQTWQQYHIIHGGPKGAATVAPPAPDAPPRVKPGKGKKRG